MKKKFLSYILLFLFIFNTISVCQIPNIHAQEKRTIQVGYVPDSPLISRDNTGRYHGFIVDYFNEISLYTNWNIDYVECEADNTDEMFKQNKVDLVFPFQKNEYRKKHYVFSQTQIGPSQNLIYTLKETDVCFKEYDSFDGLTFGFIKGTIQPSKFKQHAKNHDINYHSKYYVNNEALFRALNSGDVDAIVCDSLDTPANPYKLVDTFSECDSYFMAPKKNAQIIKQLNRAVDKINSHTPGFFTNLNNNYFTGKASSCYPLFTREDLNYIHRTHDVNVGIYTDTIPYAFYEEDSLRGIYPYILEELSKISGLHFVPTSLDSSVSADSQLTESTPVVAGIGIATTAKHSEQLFCSTDVLHEDTLLIQPENANYSSLDHLTIAVPHHYSYVKSYLAANNASTFVKTYSSVQACMDAVRDHKCDAAFVGHYTAGRLLHRPHYETLSVNYKIHVIQPLNFMVSLDGDPSLSSIINKSIEQLNPEDMEQRIAKINDEHPYHYTALDFLEKNRSLIAAIVIALFVITFLTYRVTKERIQAAAIEYEKDLFRLKSETDELTGLYNSETFFQKAGEMIQKDPPNTYLLTTVNIEHFKIINDVYGYEAGDEFLKYAGSILSSMVEKYNGLCARLENDCFVCLLPSTVDVEDAFSKSFQKQLNNYEIDNTLVACFGIYYIDNFDFPIYMMCDFARMASQNAYGQYNSHVATFTTQQHTQFLQEHRITSEMEAALEDHQFKLFIQPKNNLHTEKAIGGECLVRWQHPKDGIISPDLFIPIFEKNSFITRLDLYLIEESCKLIEKWQKRGKDILPISINLSRMDFSYPNLPDTICNICDKYHVNYDHLQLEVTESAYYRNTASIEEQLLHLQKKGFKILMDDFGSEYSSLSMLKDSPVDILKLDLHFLTKTDRYSRSNKIVSSVVSLARKLDIDLIVEGVETKDQVEFLKEIGVDNVQGYYFSKPLPINEYENYIEEHA